MRGHPEYYQDVAARLTAEIPGAFYVNQFGNPANPLAHETTTGPEIWEQMNHDLDAVVVGVGSGGTLSGLGRFFKKVAPNVEMILADPTGSILYEWVKTGKLAKAGSWAVEGIGEDFIPDIADMSLVRDAFEIDDAESFAVARELLRKEGILAGSSTGTLLGGALRYCRQQTERKAGRHLHLRHGQQVSLQDVQRFLDGGPGFLGTPDPGRSARSHFSSIRKGRSHLGRA